MANYAKAPSFTLPPPLSSRTNVCATDIVAITQQGKEQVTCQGTIVYAVSTFHHCALLGTLLQLSRSLVTARNAQQCQGTFIRTATNLVVAAVLCAAAIVAATEKGKKWPMMPRRHCPLCHHLSVLPPLSLLRERARDSQ
jgi:hypothetical protein